ncbi:Uncharacterised protein [Acidipropionibacterium jensenii]|uniref:DUF2746 domain-containing protein n=1 Tax=Acidipropionibacterium jensenii TaxID=1749 RepID=A0A448P1L9_9ACTN|nr:hypothetical protein [Acidipropionibacterium jensenii]VEI04097.1 Uncharacterised protein [Acidipropionibacterium jensenii]
MHITPDQFGAAVGGLIVMLGALGIIVAKGWQALADIRGEVKHDHGSSMKDASTRTEEKVDSLGAALHAVETGLGGIRDEIRNNRRHADEEHESLRDELHELRGSADRTHRDLSGGQKDLASQLDELTNPCAGWDFGDHVTSHTNQED